MQLRWNLYNRFPGVSLVWSWWRCLSVCRVTDGSTETPYGKHTEERKTNTDQINTGTENKNRRIMMHHTTDCTETSVYIWEHGHTEKNFYTLYKLYIIFHDCNRAFVDMHMYTVFMWSVIRWFVNRVRQSWIYIQCAFNIWTRCSESNLNSISAHISPLYIYIYIYIYIIHYIVIIHN